MFELRDYQTECVQRVMQSFERYRQAPCKEARSELLVLPTGCHRAGQGILLYDGSIEQVEDVQVGDLLMGPDSTPRRVLELHRGVDDMVEICPVKGEPWIVNKRHILSLVQLQDHPERPYPSCQRGGIRDVSITSWQQWNKTQKHLHKLYRVGVEFPCQGQPLPLHPYLLGVLLGDGGLSINGRVHLTNPDSELVQEVERLAAEQGWYLKEVSSENRCQSYRLSGREGKGRPKDGVQTVKRIMEQLGLLPIRCEHRFVPHQFKVASRQERLELLAGLLDTDGHCDKSGFEFSSKSEQMANDVMFVARSLGLAAYKSPKVVNGTTYYRVSISGDCSVIPTRIERKQAPIRQQKKDVLHTGFTIQPTGTLEEYYGFTVDGDHRYLLDDFTVTHNSGKTIVFSRVIHLVNERYGLNALIIAHRDELLDQAIDKYRLIKPDAIIGKVGSGLHQYGGEVTVASIQTIMRPEHLKRLQAIGYGLIITDEAHHSQAAGYQAVYEALPDAFHLMVTATPDRLDGKPILDRPALYSASIIDMIQDKYLCDVRAIAIRTETNLDNLHTQMGDFNERELAEAVDTPLRNARVVEAYKEHAPDRRAACFAVTVAHAEHLASTFSLQGIPAGVVCGTTPLDERKQLFRQFHDGSIKILCTVNVLSEGWDEPMCDCIIMARPTQSRSLYVQAIGRGLRLAPGKQDCVILDLTDNCLKHRLEPQNLSKALGKKLLDGETIEDALAREEREFSEREKQIRKLKDTRVKDVHVDLMQKLTWTPRPDGKFVLVVGLEKHRIALVPSEEFDGYYRVVAKLAPLYQAQYWTEAMPLDWAQQQAEKRARLLLADAKAVKLVDRTASWRGDPASTVQLEKLEKYKARFGLSYDPETVTKGEASDLLDIVFGKFAEWRQAKEARKVGA